MTGNENKDKVTVTPAKARRNNSESWRNVAFSMFTATLEIKHSNKSLGLSSTPHCRRPRVSAQHSTAGAQLIRLKKRILTMPQISTSPHTHAHTRKLITFIQPHKNLKHQQTTAKACLLIMKHCFI